MTLPAPPSSPRSSRLLVWEAIFRSPNYLHVRVLGGDLAWFSLWQTTIGRALHRGQRGLQRVADELASLPLVPVVAPDAEIILGQWFFPRFQCVGVIRCRRSAAVQSSRSFRLFPMTIFPTACNSISCIQTWLRSRS